MAQKQTGPVSVKQSHHTFSPTGSPPVLNWCNSVWEGNAMGVCSPDRGQDHVGERRVFEGCLQGPGQMCLCGTEKHQHTLRVANTPGASACSPKCTVTPGVPHGHCPGSVPGVSRPDPGYIPGCPGTVPYHASMAPPGAAAGRGGLAGGLFPSQLKCKN